MKILIKKIIIWFAAVFITLAASVYQRMTGPTYPMDIKFRFDSESYRIDLPRSHGGNTDCPVEIELPKDFTGKIIFRRYPTDDNWDTINFYRNNRTLLAFLPQQPPAGKLEYHIELEKNGVPVTLDLKKNIVIRFKGEVPDWALIPHVFFMFFAMLWSNATGIQAATGLQSYKRNALITLILFVTGGLILGPIVQKFAFGAYWTGWPFGEDLTDNKVLLSVIFWLVAYFVNRKNEKKWLIIFAAVFLFVIYMIPHSARGSELDYETGNVVTGILILFSTVNSGTGKKPVRMYIGNKRILMLITLAFMLSPVVFSRTKYVSPNGSDANKGTAEFPFQSIHHALEQQTYDTLILLSGTYPVMQPLVIKRSGTKDQNLVIMANERHGAVIDANNYTIENHSGKTPSRSGIASLHISGVEHITIDGLLVRDSHGMGIAVAHKTKNIILQHCKVVNSFNSGIGLWYSDNVRVLNCEVIGANNKDWKTPEDRVGREAPHEAITIAGATNFEVAYNEVHHCYKEGIDCKEVSANGIIHHNHMHDLPRQGLYVDCWFGDLHDVEFCHNRVHDCEWGMAVSGEGKDAGMRNIYIHHNLLYNNRGSGIFFGIWGFDVRRDSIFIYNNTVINNGSPEHWAGPTGGIDMRSTNFSNTFIFNNICSENYSYEIGCSLEPQKRSEWQKENNITVTHNHTGAYKSINDSPGAYGYVYAFRGDNSSEGDPGLSKTTNFRIFKNSPAYRPGWQLAPTGPSDFIGYMGIKK